MQLRRPARIQRKDNSIVGQIGSQGQPFRLTGKENETARHMPVIGRFLDNNPGNSPEYALEIYTIGRRVLYLAGSNNVDGDLVLSAYDSLTNERLEDKDVTLNFPSIGSNERNYIYGVTYDGDYILGFLCSY